MMIKSSANAIIGPYSRYVAYFDMLGVKSATLKNPHKVWGALSDLHKAKEEILEMQIDWLTEGWTIRDRVHAFIFSNTIVLFSLKDEPQDLVAICTLSGELFARALKTCVPLRGGISVGEFWFNENLRLFSGIPLVQAYSLGERAQWSGIVVDDRVAELTRAIPLNSGGAPCVIEYMLPIKGGETISQMVMNWPAIYGRGFEQLPVTVPAYYQAFDSLFGP